ncbi:helix-turn-helix transcriptional regulator [Candidatus Microgenomates bacterium]|nr:helix-turn-helix transcriptional regulator [Candidatus Microgenomates bacterium]
MDWKTHRQELLEDSKVREALKETELEYQIAKSLIEVRAKRGLTQKELAKRLGTKQSVLSRVENARTVPTVSFLKKLAKALDASLSIKFEY